MSFILSWYIHIHIRSKYFILVHHLDTSWYISTSQTCTGKKRQLAFLSWKRKQTRTEDLSQPVIRNGPTQLLEGYALVITVFNPKDVKSWNFPCWCPFAVLEYSLYLIDVKAYMKRIMNIYKCMQISTHPIFHSCWFWRLFRCLSCFLLFLFLFAVLFIPRFKNLLTFSRSCQNRLMTS